MRVERRQVEGTTDWYVEGQVMSRLFASADMPAYNAIEKVEQFREAGIDLYITELFDPFMFCWDGRDEYYYDHYEAHLSRLIAVRPDIRLIVYIGARLGAPYRWACDHIDQLAQLSNGTRKTSASLASRVWLDQSSEAIRRAVAHFEQSRFGEHIVGYNLTMLGTEWLTKLGGDHNPEDFSAPMRDHFRAWLREYYAGDEQRLHRRWRDPGASFDAATVPSAEERLDAGSTGFFAYCETRGFRLADYFRCYDEACARAAVTYAKAVKEGCGGRKLAGMCHGYSYLYPHGGGAPHGRGHAASERLFKSEHIDFFHSPYGYYNRCLGGAHFAQQAVDSILMRGKIYADQMDLKTHVKAMPNTNARNPWESDQLIRQCVIYPLAKNAHQYWYDINVGCYAGMTSPVLWERNHYDDPEISTLISRLRRLIDDNQAARSRRIEQVAMFTSHQGHYHRRIEKVHANFYTEALRCWFLPYTGCPYDEYNLEDFQDIDRPYKVLIFPDAWWVPADQREAIRRRIEAGATAVFSFAPGYVDDTGCALDHCEALTGIRLAKEEIEDWHQVEITDFSDPVTSGLDRCVQPDYPAGAWMHDGPASPSPRWPAQFGSDCDPEFFRKSQEWFQWLTWGESHTHEMYRFQTRFHADDPDAKVLGRLRGTQKAGLVVKALGRGRVIYIAAPCPPPELLRNIFASAGVHLFSAGTDLVYANDRYIGFCANGVGAKRLTLPEPRHVAEPLDDRDHGTTASVSFRARHGEVRIFRTVRTEAGRA